MVGEKGSKMIKYLLNIKNRILCGIAFFIGMIAGKLMRRIWAIQNYYRNRSLKRWVKENKRHLSGKYCDVYKCLNPRIGHSHGSGVFYYCKKHKPKNLT